MRLWIKMRCCNDCWCYDILSVATLATEANKGQQTSPDRKMLTGCSHTLFLSTAFSEKTVAAKKQRNETRVNLAVTVARDKAATYKVEIAEKSVCSHKKCSKTKKYKCRKTFNWLPLLAVVATLMRMEFFTLNWLYSRWMWSTCKYRHCY